MGADPDRLLGDRAAADGELKAFFVRKERKEHGLQRWIEGPEIAPGERALVVEDIVTTGGSFDRRRSSGCSEEGIELAGALAVVDRLAGGARGDRGGARRRRCPTRRCSRSTTSTRTGRTAGWLIPRRGVCGGASGQAGQGRRVKPMLVAWASPRTQIQRRPEASSACGWSWNQSSRPEHMGVSSGNEQALRREQLVVALRDRVSVRAAVVHADALDLPDLPFPAERPRGPDECGERRVQPALRAG